MPKKYGKNKEEERLQQSIASREIVKTILEYGITQYQIQKIIYLLSLELENREMMDSIYQILKTVLDSSDEENQQGLITT